MAEGGCSRFDNQEIDSPNVIHAIIRWYGSLDGKLSLQDSLAELVVGLGAEVGVILRTQMADLNPASIAVCDNAKNVVMGQPLRRTFADAYFGATIRHAQAPSIWQASAHIDDATGDPSLCEWQAARGLKEFVALILASGPKTRDHIELHFRNPLSAKTETLLQVMLPDMARAWANRKVGLITRTILNHRSNDPWGFRHPKKANILGADNPLQLSRAEFRVCLLLSMGLVVQALAKELSLSEPTIRTHLRNIYAKSECGSLAELVFQLVTNQSPPERPSVRLA